MWRNTLIPDFLSNSGFPHLTLTPPLIICQKRVSYIPLYCSPTLVWYYKSVSFFLGNRLLGVFLGLLLYHINCIIRECFSNEVAGLSYSWQPPEKHSSLFAAIYSHNIISLSPLQNYSLRYSRMGEYWLTYNLL